MFGFYTVTTEVSGGCILYFYTLSKRLALDQKIEWRVYNLLLFLFKRLELDQGFEW